jgi:ABC-2 type transport system permease protein
MFPLDILPSPWEELVRFMPLKYLAYFPAAVYLGKIPDNRLWLEVGVEAGWVLLFILLSRRLLSAGYNRYSGFGG